MAVTAAVTVAVAVALAFSRSFILAGEAANRRAASYVTRREAKQASLNEQDTELSHSTCSHANWP